MASRDYDTMDPSFQGSEVKIPTNPKEHPFQPVLDLIEQYSKAEKPRSDPWSNILSCYMQLKEVEKQNLIRQLNLTESQKKLLGILWKQF